MPKSKLLRKKRSAEVVDMAGIDTRIFTLPREISGCREHLREVSRPVPSQRYVIVAGETSRDC